MSGHKPIPVIDLFAGPGGLGEGFSSILDPDRNPLFSLKVSAEKDVTAHKTLSLRSLYRKFPKERFQTAITLIFAVKSLAKHSSLIQTLQKPDERRWRRLLTLNSAKTIRRN
jgi:site-specific DNA-cytosine methylase